MGRIKTKLIKRVTRELMHNHSDEMGSSFDENKKVVLKYVDAQSKKLSNMITGYATRLKKKTAVAQ